MQRVANIFLKGQVVNTLGFTVQKAKSRLLLYRYTQSFTM